MTNRNKYVTCPDHTGVHLEQGNCVMVTRIPVCKLDPDNADGCGPMYESRYSATDASYLNLYSDNERDYMQSGFGQRIKRLGE